MKNLKLQITFDLELNDFREDPILTKTIIAYLEKGILRAVGEGLFPDEVQGWDMDIKIVNLAKVISQVEVEKLASNYTIHAYFSSDGPAVLVSQTGSEQPIDPNLLHDINNAIREAHHKYIAEVRQG